MYVPPYARFVYGPTKCYFLHMCVFGKKIIEGFRVYVKLFDELEEVYHCLEVDYQ